MTERKNPEFDMENTAIFHEWTDYLEALRNGNITHEVGNHRRVVYNSSYSDKPQVIEGEIESKGDSIGKPFRIDGKIIKGWHVESNSREIGRVKKIEVEK